MTPESTGPQHPLNSQHAAPSSEAPAPMQHVLVVRHAPGLDHAAIAQLVQRFQPLNIRTGMNPANLDESSSVLFATLQQAHAAQQAVVHSSAGTGCAAATSIVSIPLQLPLPLPQPHDAASVALQPQPVAPCFPPSPRLIAPPPWQSQHHQRRLSEPELEGCPMPPQLPPRALRLQPQLPSLQEQLDAVTMRPLYAVPRPECQSQTHMPPQHSCPIPWIQPPQPGHPLLAGPPPPHGGHLAAAAFSPPPFHYPGPTHFASFDGGSPAWQPGRCGHGCEPSHLTEGLPETLDPASCFKRRLNPAAAAFSPSNPHQAASAAASAAAGPLTAWHGADGSYPVTHGGAMPPVIHSIFNGIEAALAGRPFVPCWDGMPAPRAPQDPEPPVSLLVAEPVQCDSGTEVADEGEADPNPRHVFAAVSAANLNACFITRALMRQLAPVEVVLKATLVGDPAAGPSVLAGAVVRVLIDKTYKLRQIQSSFIKPESSRLMLVLHDVNSPIPAEHISNTNPLALAPGEALGSSAEGELLELQAKLAFHGRRLFRHEVAATAWRLQLAEHWQRQQGGKQGDELRLATAQLKDMLADKREIKWRCRGVVGLDVGQETDLLVRAFRLPWTVAASWMAHSSPNAELLPGAGAGVGGGTPSSADRSSFTGEYHTRPPYNEVLGPTDTSSDLSSGARRALLRSAASPALHDRFMATVCGGGSSEPQPATAGLGMPAAATPASDDPAPVAVAPVPANGVPAPDSEGSAGSSAASLAGSHAAELAHEEARLLAEAASWGAEAEADRVYMEDSFSGQSMDDPFLLSASAEPSPKHSLQGSASSPQGAGSPHRVAAKAAA
ncbi:hypothetical protein D9Q98_001396 [Chlorella vulgaris]|uniref:Uncharacterized protein n=1 Tax=Chlorella vulgaris TaxID=3077 RepID=A0A9D4Z353_CHLVU|nr:hypothetical protein D9Q98_001396 [Chlorella vulgaris]